jgi:hypothetical protein
MAQYTAEQLGAFTIQENRMMGSSESQNIANSNGRFWTPVSLLEGSSTIEEVNKIRADIGEVPVSFLPSILGREDVKVSINKVSEIGETTKDPEILVLDEKTGTYIPSAELTAKYYSHLKVYEERGRKEGKPETFYPFFLREAKSLFEKESPGLSEGGTRTES